MYQMIRTWWRNNRSSFVMMVRMILPSLIVVGMLVVLGPVKLYEACWLYFCFSAACAVGIMFWFKQRTKMVGWGPLVLLATQYVVLFCVMAAQHPFVDAVVMFVTFFLVTASCGALLVLFGILVDHFFFSPKSEGA